MKLMRATRKQNNTDPLSVVIARRFSNGLDDLLAAFIPRKTGLSERQMELIQERAQESVARWHVVNVDNEGGREDQENPWPGLFIDLEDGDGVAITVEYFPASMLGNRA